MEGGLFSVALSVSLRNLGVTQSRPNRSPDFPRMPISAYAKASADKAGNRSYLAPPLKIEFRVVGQASRLSNCRGTIHCVSP